MDIRGLCSNFVGEFCEWVQFRIDIYIPKCKYQVKTPSSLWFSSACAASIVHRDHLFRFYQQSKSAESKVKFKQASNCCKRVIEAVKLAYASKTRVQHFPETWLSALMVYCQ